MPHIIIQQYGNLKNMKVNVPGGSSIEEMASALRDKPDVLHKMPMIPNYGNASITDGDKETLEKAKVALNCSSCEQVFVKVLWWQILAKSCIC
jgi:hypothetical protein